jgi:hypothetical protein
MLARVAVELVDRLAILVTVRRCHGMGIADSRSMCVGDSVRMMNEFVTRYVLFVVTRYDEVRVTPIPTN